MGREHKPESTALTGAQLRSAAEHAVAGGHALAAVLFGSRARGTATPESDWDVCLVTDDEDARSETERHQALEVDAALWSDARIQILWKTRREFHRVNAGSVEEAIAREGKVLAGDVAIVAGAALKPFRASAVGRDLIVARANLVAGIWIAEEHAAGAQSEESRRNAALAMSIDAIAAIEALGRALCVLTATPIAGIHDVAANGRWMQALGEAAEDGTWGALLRAIGARLVAVDRDGGRLRRAGQSGEPLESYEDAAERLALGLETDVWTRSGLCEGKGPWARLARHPRGAELREAIADDTAAAARAADQERRGARVKLGSETLERAVTEWYEAYARRPDGAGR